MTVKNTFKIIEGSKWQAIVFAILLVAIIVYFLLSLAPFKAFKAENIPLLVAIFICGIPLLANILIKLFQGNYGADFLAVIAVGTGVYLHQYLAVTIVMLMIASGQMLEVYAVRKASSVLLALAERMPSTVHRMIGKKIVDSSINKLRIGDIVMVYPHETCPVDGIVLQGHGSMDESYLTGEPYLVPKAPGVAVLSGSINGDTLLKIRAQKLPQDSRYAKIMKVMEESEQRKPKIRRLGDQLGIVFAPLTLIISFSAWYFSGDAIRFLAVLVMATPCPLLIAIPITIISAISLAARRGIIIKDPVVLERLPTCKTAIFDKTGTLTYGHAELVDITPLPGFSAKTILQQAASLERFSKHPLAQAIVKAAHIAKLSILEAEQVNEIRGQGLVGSFNGKTIQITNREKLNAQNPRQTKSIPPIRPGMESIILIDKKVAAVFRFRDSLRVEGPSFVAHLTPIHHFEKIMIVSGDRKSEVSYIANQLGIKEIYASQTPEQKTEIVRHEMARAPTMFMGDGINDAPALAAATVGIAFGQHNIVTSEAAGAVVLESSLVKVDELIHISGLMRRVALVSAVGGMLLSFIGMYFAALGIITPVLGALLQEGIDVLAILNALQLTWHSKIMIDIHQQ